MQPPIGICGAADAPRVNPLHKAGGKPVPARTRPHSITGVPVNMRRLLLLIAHTLIILVASASLEVHAADTPVRIGGVTYIGDAPTVIADQRGLFTANDVQAEVSYAVAGKHNLERLRAGEIDFALLALTPLVIDRLSDETPGRDDDPVILANLIHATHLNEILVPATSPIDDPRDLAGRTVGLSRGTGAEFVWWLFTRYHGLDPASVTVIDQPANELPDALVSGSIDAAILWSPWRARLESRTGQELHSFAGVDIYTAKWVLVTRRAVSNEEPAQCRAILSAYRDAIRFIQQRPEQAMRMYAEHADIDPQDLEEPWDPLIYDINLDWNVVTTLQQQFEWARRDTPMKNASGGILSLLAPSPLRELLPNSVSIPDPPEEPAR